MFTAWSWSFYFARLSVYCGEAVSNFSYNRFWSQQVPSKTVSIVFIASPPADMLIFVADCFCVSVELALGRLGFTIYVALVSKVTLYN